MASSEEVDVYITTRKDEDELRSHYCRKDGCPAVEMADDGMPRFMIESYEFTKWGFVVDRSNGEKYSIRKPEEDGVCRALDCPILELVDIIWNQYNEMMFRRPEACTEGCDESESQPTVVSDDYIPF